MQKEIGSVLEFTKYDDYSFPDGNTFCMPFMKNMPADYKTYFFQNARNAIEALAIFLKQKMPEITVYLPDFVCDTVPEAFERAHVRIANYHINSLLETEPQQLLDIKDKKNICIFICHFFGKPIQDELIQTITSLQKKGIIIMEDLTMSLYSEDGENVGFGDYIIGSIRKWLPIPDGGFISVRTDRDYRIPQPEDQGQYAYLYSAVQSMKREYTLGGYEDKALKNTYMQYYKEAVKVLFSDYTIRKISKLSENYILANDYHDFVSKRCENYDYLYSGLSDSVIIHPIVKREKHYVPFMFTAFCDCRDELLEYLIAEDIYCNIHWKLKQIREKDTQFLCDHLISIPCDQRYGTEEMEHIIRTIKNFEKQRIGE